MARKNIRLMLTVPAHSDFEQVIDDPIVEGARINTTIPVKLTLEETLSSIKDKTGKKDAWIDLKCRQLRIAKYNVDILQDREIHCIELSHNIKVNTPTEVLFDNGNVSAVVDKVIDNNKLIIPSSIERRKGIPLPSDGEIGLRIGMSATILDPSLIVEGYLTERDKEYVKSAKKIGLHNYMLSFVEQEQDIADLLALDEEAKIIAKIESQRGLDFASNVFPKYRKIFSPLHKRIHLMAARGDLYLQLEPDKIIDACQKIIENDSGAIFASRILESFADPVERPKCNDIFDVYAGMLMGYKRFMIGDDVCRRKDSIRSAIGFFNVLSNKYEELTA